MSRRFADFSRPLPEKSWGGNVSVAVAMLAGVMVLIIVGIAIAALLTTRPAHAHESWINRGGFKNIGGEWCCGDYDCKAYKTAQSAATGWLIEGELVPYDEAMPVAPPDGQLTICRRPDGTRRCVFGLRPGT